MKCAPEIGPRIVISTTSIAPVAMVLPSSARAMSLVSVSAMMPEPTTVATRSAVPSASAASLRGRSKVTAMAQAASVAGAAATERGSQTGAQAAPWPQQFSVR